MKQILWWIDAFMLVNLWLNLVVIFCLSIPKTWAQLRANNQDLFGSGLKF